MVTIETMVTFCDGDVRATNEVSDSCDICDSGVLVIVVTIVI